MGILARSRARIDSCRSRSSLQRMVIFTWLCTIPIGIFWFFACEILKRIVPDQAVAVLAGQYLKILVIGAPAYACFESSKRYVQAQGKFIAVTYVLAVAAPANVFMHWLFVWVSDSSSCQSNAQL